jgi:hypothetical protein
MRRPATPLFVAVGLGLASVAVAGRLLARHGDLFGGPRGPRGSSYATGPQGLSQYAALLRAHGHEVQARRQPLDDADEPLDPATALVVLDAERLTVPEAQAIRRFTEAGGRAVLGGTDPTGWLPHVMDDSPLWIPQGKVSCRALVRVPEDAGVDDVVLSSSGEWATAGASLPFLACDGRISATVAAVGNSGRLVLLSDSGPLQNQWLSARTDAQLGVDLVGNRSTVVFDEQVHGFSAAAGLGAVPVGVQVALLLLLAAGLVLAASRAARPGVPREESAPGPVVPARTREALAVGAHLARSRDRAAVAQPLQRAGRAHLVRAAGLPWDGTDEEVRAAGARLGVDSREVDALLLPARTRGDVVAAARALAVLSGRD